MRFLDGAEARRKIAELTAKSRNVRIAVAFWGEGAAEGLALLSKPSATTIICNLRMGGTNPDEIRLLRDAGVKVYQSDTLHAKVYLFDNHVIVGSSNGLSFQESEGLGWIEANVLSDQPAFQEKASQWFDNLPRQKIEEEDLKAAAEIWSRRRSIIQFNWPPGSTLVDALKSNPPVFKGRRFYLCAYSKELDAAGEEALSNERKARGSQAMPPSEEKLFAFQDWPQLPDSADLVCFFVGPRGGVHFDGFCQMPKQRQEIACRNQTTLQLCFSIDTIAGFPQSPVGSDQTWGKAIRRFIDWPNNDGPAFLDLGDFATRYL
jgi:PLD-like domain